MAFPDCDCGEVGCSALPLPHKTKTEAVLIDPTGRVDHKLVANGNPKAVFGMAKIPLGLVPPVALAHCADAMRDGASKYGAWNFREVQISASVYYNACKRHLDLWFAGQDKASDSGVKHLGHAMACLALILDSEFNGNLHDDRPPYNLDADALENLFKSLEK